jgi:predicted metal-dependent phosphotriesterase family hydrolase
VESIRTVSGDIAAHEAGAIMFHEHPIVDLGSRLNNADLRLLDPAAAAEELRVDGRFPLGTIVSATPLDMGSRPDLVREVSDLSGVHIVQGTGYFRQDTYPPEVADASVEELAARMCGELVAGVAGTRIRAGVIGEIGMSPGGITNLERTVTRAAAAAHLYTGAPVITHTADGEFAIEQADLLLDAGVDPGKLVIGHMDRRTDFPLHLELVRRGLYIGYDSVGRTAGQPDSQRVRFVVDMIECGYLEQVLLSCDIARRSRLRRWGGTGYEILLRDFLDALSEHGVSDEELGVLMVENPQRFLRFQARS